MKNLFLTFLIFFTTTSQIFAFEQNINNPKISNSISETKENLDSQEKQREGKWNKMKQEYLDSDPEKRLKIDKKIMNFRLNFLIGSFTRQDPREQANLSYVQKMREITGFSTKDLSGGQLATISKKEMEYLKKVENLRRRNRLAIIKIAGFDIEGSREFEKELIEEEKKFHDSEIKRITDSDPKNNSGMQQLIEKENIRHVQKIQKIIGPTYKTLTDKQEALIKQEEDNLKKSLEKEDLLFVKNIKAITGFDFTNLTNTQKELMQKEAENHFAELKKALRDDNLGMKICYIESFTGFSDICDLNSSYYKYRWSYARI